MTEAVFVAFPVPRDQIPVCTHVRTTLIGASLLALRKHSLFDRYLSHLPAAHHTEIAYCTPGQWLPIQLGHVHYTACEAMELPVEDVVRNGSSVSLLAQKTMFSYVLRLAVDGGVTPWAMINSGTVHWQRSYQGSAIAAYKVGPKECRLDIVGNPLAAIPYWRLSLRGILTSLTGAFSTRAYVRELRRQPASPMSVGYQVSWV